ncbi:sensor histidine kinase [Angustibacter luteus]|uniref:histidine kinase n=1 Tax=Angustibacter luteus TaxID=658456 RepID=A0ABW1J975_9ACTN
MSLVARLRSTRLDVLLTGILMLAGIVQQAFFPIAGPVPAVLYVVGSTLPLAWRHTYPVESALASSAFWLIPLDGYPVLGFVVVLLQFFSLGSLGAPRLAVVLVTVWAALASVAGTLLGPEQAVASVGAVLVVVAPVLAGRLVRHQRAQNLALASLAEQLRAERLRAEEAAVGSERARIAQELHDVVGHEVTLIAIQAEAAAAALRVTPERAVEPVEAIRSTAHRTLGEIRGVLDVLSPQQDAQRAGEEDLLTLAARARSVGIANSLAVTGDTPPEQTPVALAVHRIVRECLTNAGRHALGAIVCLNVDWTPDMVEVRSTNDVAASVPPVPGRGLTGIRHRAELLGGSYDATCVNGRFEVRVRIPLIARATP